MLPLLAALGLFTLGSGGLCPLPDDAVYGMPCDSDGECAGAYRCGDEGRCVPDSLHILDGGLRTDGGGEGEGEGEGEGDGGQLRCEHEGADYDDGDEHPASLCLVCAAGSGWVSSCEAGELCGDDGCVAGCVVGDVTYEPGAPDPERLCWRCAPEVSTTSFTPTELATPCDDDDLCTLSTTCDGEGACLPAAEVVCTGLDEACAVGVCAPESGTCGTAPLATGVGCGDGLVCDGVGACLAGCFVGGALYEDGEPSPGAACRGCVASVSTTSFSSLPEGIDCGGGLACDGAGSCGPSCLIDEVLYPNGSSDPDESCRFCDSAVSLSDWQARPDDTPCEDDENICTETLCGAGVCTSVPLDSGTPCGEGVCDGAGACSAPQTLLVVLAGAGVGAVSSLPAGIDCGDDCEEEVTFGATVTLTATADAATSAFVGWSGACSGTDACVVQMTRARAVTASFAPLPRALTVTKQGAGTGTLSSSPAGIACGATCTTSYDHGVEVTLSAVATSGTSTFGGWSGEGCSGTGTCVVTMDAARSLTATFTPVPRTLSVTQSGSGGGTVTSTPAGIDCDSTCSGPFDHNTPVTLTATPDENSDFSGWTGEGCSGTEPCVLTMDAARAVTATFTLVNRTVTVSRGGNGTGTVTSTPSGIDCGATCSGGFPHGTSVTLAAGAGANSSFTGWSGEGCSGTAGCVVAADATRSVTATFTLDNRTLTVSKSGNGTVTSNPAGIQCGATCAAGFPHATSVTLTAAPDSDNDFAGWSGGGCGGTGTCTVSMAAATTVTATFEPAPQSRALTVQKSGNGSGTVTSSPGGISCGTTCSANYIENTDVTLSASEGANSSFGGFSGGGCAGPSPCTVTMDVAKTVTATFTLVNRTLTVQKNGGASGTVTSNVGGINCGGVCSSDFSHGTLVTLTAAEGANSNFTGWSESGCGAATSCDVSMTAAKTVTATFVPEERRLTVGKTGNGSGTVSANIGDIHCGSTCYDDYNHGDVVNLTVEDGANSTFAGWSNACTGSGTCSVTMDAAKSVTATFTLVNRTLTVSKSGSGTVTSSPGGINCGPTCSTSYTHGTAVTLSATPADGYSFAGFTGDCTGPTCNLTMNAARSVTATFVTVPTYSVQVCVSSTDGGYHGVTSDPPGINCYGNDCCSAEFPEGTTVYLYPDGNLQSWSGSCLDYYDTCVLYMDQSHWANACFSDSGGPTVYCPL